MGSFSITAEGFKTPSGYDADQLEVKTLDGFLTIKMSNNLAQTFMSLSMEEAATLKAELDKLPGYSFANECWAETHHQFVWLIEKEISDVEAEAINHNTEISSVVFDLLDEQGQGAIWQLAIRLANEFHNLFADYEWGKDDQTQFEDFIERFYSKKMYSKGGFLYVEYTMPHDETYPLKDKTMIPYGDTVELAQTLAPVLQDERFEVILKKTELGTSAAIGDKRNQVSELVKHLKEVEINFPNGFTNWKDTYFEVVKVLTGEYGKDEQNPKLAKETTMGGYCELYVIADQLTYEFEKANEGREWHGEFADEVREHVEAYLKSE